MSENSANWDTIIMVTSILLTVIVCVFAIFLDMYHSDKKAAANASTNKSPPRAPRTTGGYATSCSPTPVDPPVAALPTTTTQYPGDSEEFFQTPPLNRSCPSCDTGGAVLTETGMYHCLNCGHSFHFSISLT